jgi:hypothetical protein
VHFTGFNSLVILGSGRRNSCQLLLLTSSINYKSSVAPGRTSIEYPAFSKTYRKLSWRPTYSDNNEIRTTMKKIFKRILKITLLVFTTTILTIAAIILFPQRLFANKMEYKNFTVYSNEKIGNDIKIVLDSAMNLVKKSEIYDSNYKYNIILCYNSFYNKLDDKLFGEGPTARSRLNDVIIKVRIEPKNNLAFPTFHKTCEESLTCLLAHEMTHCLQANKYGIIKFNPFKHPELWKLEGYPEYVARKTELLNRGYSLTSEIERYVNLESKATDIWILAADEGGCEVPNYYYKGMLMIEYLIDFKHLPYDKILNDSVSENAVYQEMIKWKDSTKEVKN